MKFKNIVKLFLICSIVPMPLFAEEQQPVVPADQTQQTAQYVTPPAEVKESQQTSQPEATPSENRETPQPVAPADQNQQIPQPVAAPEEKQKVSQPKAEVKENQQTSQPATAAVENQQASQRLEEVVCTSTTIDDRFESKKDEPSNVTVISGEKVDAAHAENIVQILRSVPGVTADVDSGESVKIKLRGIENQRYMGEKPGVAIVIDGVPVFERTGKVNIDLDNIESIKIIKGSASYLFGEDALAGAVIITTKRGAKYSGLTLAGEYGSYYYNKELARLGLAGEWGSGHIQASRRSSNDYYYQGEYGSEYLDGKLQYYLTKTSDLTFGFELSQREKDSHGTVTGETQAETDPKSRIGRDYARQYDVNLDKYSLTYSNDYRDSGNFLLTAYQYGDHTEFWSAPQKYALDGSRKDGIDDYTTNNDYKQVQKGVKGEWRDGFGPLGLLAGVDVRRNTYDNFNTAKTDYCTRITTTGACVTPTATNPTDARVFAGTVLTDDKTDEDMDAVYGEVKVAPLKALTLTFNGRYDHIDLDYSSNATKDSPAELSLSKSFDVTSWRGGVNYELNDSVNFYGNVSTGFRAPTAQQLFAGDISPTGKTSSNPDLKPEQALSSEIGVRSRSEIFGVKLDTELGAFQIDRKDFILNTNGQYGGSTGVKEIYDNVGGVRNRGIELALNTDSSRSISLDVAYTYIDAVFTEYDNFNQILGNQYGSLYTTGTFNPARQYKIVSYDNSGNKVPRVPQHQVNTTLNWRPISPLKLALEMDYRSSSYADEINQEKLPSRTLFSFLANYDITSSIGRADKGSRWSLFARVDNLFDTDYWSTARGTNDSQNPITGQYDGVYNSEDPSIVVGKPRTWTAGLSMTF